MARIARKNLDAMWEKGTEEKSHFWEKGTDLCINLRKRDGGKISFMRKRDGPLWINLKFFKDTEEYLDKQDAF